MRGIANHHNRQQWFLIHLQTRTSWSNVSLVGGANKPAKQRAELTMKTKACNWRVVLTNIEWDTSPDDQPDSPLPTELTFTVLAHGAAEAREHAANIATDDHSWLINGYEAEVRRILP